MNIISIVLSIVVIVMFFLMEFLPFLIPIFFISFIRKNIINGKFKSNNIEIDLSNNNKYKDINKSRIAEFGIDDIKILKDYLYDIFYEFEKAYNNLDYNKMAKLCTSKIYNNYYTNITANLKFGHKRIMDNIERENVIIYDYFSSDYKQLFSTMIEISYYNYTVSGNGDIISGSEDNKVTEKFEVEFIKQFNNKSIIKCPNCGASVSGGKCEYCKTELRYVDFKINAIRRIV